MTDADAECCNEETVVHCRVSPHRMPNLGVVMWHASSEHQSRFPIFSQMSMWLFPIVLPSFSPKISMCFPSINRKSPWVSHHILSWSQITMCFYHPIHLPQISIVFPPKTPCGSHVLFHRASCHAMPGPKSWWPTGFILARGGQGWRRPHDRRDRMAGDHSRLVGL